MEIKVDSTLGKDQLERYRIALDKSDIPRTSLVLLARYSSLEGADKADFFIQWHRIDDWLKNALPNIKNHSAEFLTRQFIEYLQLRKLTFEAVEGESAKSVQYMARLMDEGDKLPKRIRKLEILTEFEGLIPFTMC